MSEWTIGLISTLKVLSVALFGACYWIGGRTNKWIRRILGSLLFGGCIVGFSFWQSCYSHWLLAYPVCLFIALSQGYGGDSFWEKVMRRGKYGIILGLSSLPIAISTGSWQLFGSQAVLALAASLVFGVFNPFHNAVDEENLIAILSVVLVPFYLGG